MKKEEGDKSTKLKGELSSIKFAFTTHAPPTGKCFHVSGNIKPQQRRQDIQSPSELAINRERWMDIKY